MTRQENQLRQVRAEVEAVCASLARSPHQPHEQAERDALVADDAVSRALSGTHEVFVHEDRFPDLPGNVEVPDSWASVPFARFALYQDSGDRSVGIASRSYWALAEDQKGTALFSITEEMLLMHAQLQKATQLLAAAASGSVSSAELQRAANELSEFQGSTSLQAPANFSGAPEKSH